MKRLYVTILLLAVFSFNNTFAQQYIDKSKFFKDTTVVEASLTLNFKQLLVKRAKEGMTFPAMFKCRLDSLNVNDHLRVQIRGHFRRSYCYMPPLKLIYKNNASAAFYHLKSLKLVNTCKSTQDDDQNLLKEYLVYKIYNLITDKSFRVRLLNLSYVDSSGSKRTITRHAFLLEDIKELAKRNDCTDWTGKKYATERTDRRQMTTVSIFEYMIGNTDWAVPINHNIKLVHTATDSVSKPYVVPYDFDYCGLVNTEYAIPDERLHIDNVRQRIYKGFPRTMEELNAVLDVFKKERNTIYALINRFDLLELKNKKDMIDYLDEFYKDINSPSQIREQFLTKQE